MGTLSLFATRVFRARLPQAAAGELNGELKRASLSLREEDRAGRAWSRAHRYPGYTSYASLNDLAWRLPPFAALQKRLDPLVARFARELDFDLRSAPLTLDSMWVNVLKAGGIHSAHLHPKAVVSGTYYVGVPKGAGALKLEDPRLALMMAAPARKAKARRSNQSFVYIQPEPGLVLLWESWLRHEVSAGAGKGERISISFNYS